MATVKCARGKRGRPSREWYDGKKYRVYCYCPACGAKMDGGDSDEAD